MQHDEIVGGWLSGADTVDGYENPAGALYVEGIAATEAAMTDKSFLLLTQCSSCTASIPAHCC
ncbi:DUF6229 family protein [Luteimonas sp. S4-F44]|uniref:DUF6229 family protein n=1 Tax=unclassified Luteimonas TaxID=2629088 RepID=UPI001F52C363|nr:DUF6229 family protein [Luteimonas sp. S4-F44]UNK43386.1 DUF6229 family protein [Luteimonas sp. S4-F44]